MRCACSAYGAVGTSFAVTHGKRRYGPDRHAQGNFVDHEYTIERDGDKVAEISKRWFRVADTYGVEVAPGENDILILATTGAIDEMAHPDR
jgi:uncharacterized protein YxjI